MSWPTELVAKAKYEIEVFERPSRATSMELVDEVVMLRLLVNDFRDAATTVCYSPNPLAACKLMDVIAQSRFSVPEAS